MPVHSYFSVAGLSIISSGLSLYGLAKQMCAFDWVTGDLTRGVISTLHLLGFSGDQIRFADNIREK